ncbi:MAG: hypothetical protein WCR67_07575, partial [Bacilli bacterium]
ENGYRVKQDFKKALDVLNTSLNPLVIQRKNRFFFRHLDELEKEAGLFTKDDFLKIDSSIDPLATTYLGFYNAYLASGKKNLNLLSENEVADLVFLLEEAIKEKDSAKIKHFLLLLTNKADDTLIQSSYVGKAIYEGLSFLGFPASFRIIARRLGCVRMDISHGEILNVLGGYSFQSLEELNRSYNSGMIKEEEYQIKASEYFYASYNFFSQAADYYFCESAKNNLITLLKVKDRLSIKDETVRPVAPSIAKKSQIPVKAPKIGHAISISFLLVGIALIVVGVLLFTLSKK